MTSLRSPKPTASDRAKAIQPTSQKAMIKAAARRAKDRGKQ